MQTNFVSPNEIRAQFARAMSVMYSQEVPAYSTLVTMVKSINDEVLKHDDVLRQQLTNADNLARISEERHGAIRLGTEKELFNIRRLFAVMGMQPVSYYDLSVAGIPVHSTAFRPVSRADLAANPFRVFTSLLRLELVEDNALREAANAMLAKREIFTPEALQLIESFEQRGGLTAAEADAFIAAALETFRWHQNATVTTALYEQLHETHRLVADVVSFKGPHINHLTPRTLDIDLAHRQMAAHGMQAKATIEGPPRRQCPILLRQTSFKAIEEAVNFADDKGHYVAGAHTARFGEIEQRGIALTPKGRALYDQLIHQTRELASQAADLTYEAALEQVFVDFPDDYLTLHNDGLAYFEYHRAAVAIDAAVTKETLPQQLENGQVELVPITYEDFLPVSAAGIFQSNLGHESAQNFSAQGNQAVFESALGCHVLDEFALYADMSEASLNRLLLRS
ncbi:2-oxoadipate dioxygenase/decarboxylase HglS [Ostreibacterium oceani]|uniref:2-oxoadipate dioxygenase/decarboxylase n=1 Tax=Ostreibacterium oceani TaxID=2654998 RepID=A0A6N7EWM3_9GAMM|nr:VOC family protein [Ostreibacterium oceani]MPV85819.1 DUF1338 family protein [Ostreibacterium oceani]